MEPTDRENEELLAELGLAFLQAQALEYNLVSFLTVFSARRSGMESFREFMDRLYGKTFGGVFAEARALDVLSEAETQGLRNALAERNWLVHGYFRDFGNSAFDRDITIQAFDRLRSCRALFELVSESLASRTLVEMRELGMTPEDVQQFVEEGISRLTQENDL